MPIVMCGRLTPMFWALAASPSGTAGTGDPLYGHAALPVSPSSVARVSGDGVGEMALEPAADTFVDIMEAGRQRRLGGGRLADQADFLQGRQQPAVAFPGLHATAAGSEAGSTGRSGFKDELVNIDFTVIGPNLSMDDSATYPINETWGGGQTRTVRTTLRRQLTPWAPVTTAVPVVAPVVAPRTANASFHRPLTFASGLVTQPTPNPDPSLGLVRIRARRSGFLDDRRRDWICSKFSQCSSVFLRGNSVFARNAR